jgi:hypothetical protein
MLGRMIEHLFDEQGVALRRDLVDAGVHDQAILRLRRAGSLLRVRHGVYVDPTRWEAAPPQQRHLMLARGVLRMYGDDVALSHTSAAMAYGAPDWDVPLKYVHLTDLYSAGERRQASVHHHQGVCDVHDIRRLGGHWITTPVRTALDAASVLPRSAAVVLLDHFLHAGLVTPADLALSLGRRQQWSSHLDVLLKVDQSQVGSESVGESRARLLFQDHGLPTPVLQLEICDDTGAFIGRADFAWPRQRLIVEFDGMTKYHRLRRRGETIEQAVVREKLREDRIRDQDWTVIRMTWWDLEHPAALIARLQSRLARTAA